MATIRQLQQTLTITFGVVPIVSGLDKFTNLLTHWADYLAPNIRSILPMDALVFMKVIGIIEIIAGVLVFVKPVIGAYVVTACLTVVALVLIISGNYFDVAIRDLVMAIGAFTLAQLTLITKKTPDLIP